MSAWADSGMQLYYMRHAEHFYFAAMREGYGSGKKPITLHEIPGGKQFRFDDPESNVSVIDTYLSTPDGIGSAGMTVLLFRDEPIWSMQYSGRYKPEALPLLHEALQAAYQQEQWHGGRGLPVYEREGWHYTNHVDLPSSFFLFRGIERIYDPSGELAGYHLYSGEWLATHNLNPRNL